RVGIVDTDIQSPGIHVLFGLNGAQIGKSLNDFLWGKHEIEQAAHDVSAHLGPDASGKIFLIPCSAKADEIVNVLREGYNVSLLTGGFRKLISELSLDILLIDTHPGLNEETLFSIAISHSLVIVMRPDQQDYEGTGVTVEVARSLEVPNMTLVVNKTPASFEIEAVRRRVQETYDVESVTVLPHCDEMMALASGGIFSVNHPDHVLTGLYKDLAQSLSA
ncbi:MAG: MinD/ParA family protein, partial [Pseudomonadota bacterium]